MCNKCPGNDLGWWEVEEMLRTGEMLSFGLEEKGNCAKCNAEYVGITQLCQSCLAGSPTFKAMKEHRNKYSSTRG